jgi:hypothetical protein
MRSIACLLLLLISVGSRCGADDLRSGPEVGKPAPPFDVQVLTGDDAGMTRNYLSTWKDRPVLVIFVGELTRPAFGLLKPLDKYGRLRQPDGLEVLIIRTTRESDEVTRQTMALAEKYDVKAPAGYAKDGQAGPKDYGLNEEAQMTVLLLDKEHTVRFNAAYRSADRSDFDGVRKAIDRLLGPSPVPFP